MPRLVHCARAGALDTPPDARYRLGDMVLYAARREQPGIGRSAHLELFPHSLAAEYMRRTNASWRVDVLDEILRGMSKGMSAAAPEKGNASSAEGRSAATKAAGGTAGGAATKAAGGAALRDVDTGTRLTGSTHQPSSQVPSPCEPDAGTVVVHVRLGDVLENHGNADSHVPASFYVRPIAYYAGVGAALRAWMPAVKRVVLVGATFRSGGSSGGAGASAKLGTKPNVLATGSFAHLRAIHASLLRVGYTEAQLGIRLNREPDGDVAYLAAARTFVCSGGGFSMLVAALVARRGGRCVCAGIDGCTKSFHR